MNMLKIKSTIIFLFLFSTIVLHAQPKQYPIRVSVFNESTAVPFTRFFTMPIHPGGQIGTEFVYHQKTKTYLYQTANLGYVFHNFLYQAVFLNSELGLDYKFRFGLNAKALIGLGYMHSFATQQEYVLRNGIYMSKPDLGNARLIPSLSIGAGYRLSKKKENSPELFVLYQSWLEYPYSPGFIPVMTHINLQIGAKFYFTFNFKKDDEETE